MNRNLLALAAVLLALAALPRVASAAVVYTYTGNPYDEFLSLGVPPPNPYDTSMSVSATFVLDNPVGPNRPVGPNYLTMYDWSISDGIVTLDASNTAAVAFSLGTDAGGNITSWYFLAQSDPFVAFGETAQFIESGFEGGPFLLSADIARTDNCIEFTSTGICSNQNNIRAIANTPGSWTVSPVPLPGAAWLFGGALLALGAWRRRRVA